MDKIEKLEIYYNNLYASLLSKKERNIFKRYTVCGSIDVNNYLLGNMDDVVDSNYAQEVINLLSTMIPICKLPFPITIYRGVTESNFYNQSIIKKDSLINKTFISTSLDIYTAIRFMNHNLNVSDKALLLKIFLPQNFPAIFMKPFSIFPYENEFVLPTCTDFFIKSKKRSDLIGLEYEMYEVNPKTMTK